MISNKIFIEGNSLIIEANAPIVGLINLLDWVDTTVGEDNVNYFFKEYRISVNGGLNWGAWKGLSKTNLLQEQVNSSDVFLIQYKYTKFGDNVSEISFENVTVFGEKTEPSCPVEYNNSIFKQFFDCNDVNVLNWCINVTQKLYERGIVPTYMERNNGEDDSDYIAYWSTVACFFSMVVNYGRQFQRFYNNPQLLVKYLKSLDLRLFDSENISDMKYYMENALSIVNQRGTLGIVRKKDGDIPAGELLQLISFDEKDEFIFDLVQRDKNGWWLDNSSPLYKSSLSANKFYERSFTDESKYSLLSPSNVTFTDGKMVISPASGGTGLDPTLNADYSIAIDNRISYQFSFNIKKSNTSLTYIFGVIGSDDEFNQVSMINAITGFDTNTFGNTASLNQDDVEYKITGIIYKEGTATNSSYKLNTNEGNNLIFKEDCSYIQPYIICYGTGDAEISKVEIKPLDSEQKEYNGVMQPYRRINVWCVNNGTLSEEQIIEVAEQKLINYNQEIEINFIKTPIIDTSAKAYKNNAYSNGYS